MEMALPEDGSPVQILNRSERNPDRVRSAKDEKINSTSIMAKHNGLPPTFRTQQGRAGAAEDTGPCSV